MENSGKQNKTKKAITTTNKNKHTHTQKAKQTLSGIQSMYLVKDVALRICWELHGMKCPVHTQLSYPSHCSNRVIK